ncbi:MAG: hypothetical protein KatS3mg035_0068 [Bacteroidia bacterium]|nr:MAG: hypothetical protein KatS3mg035_0068 [Bacteroidia bacterium]
MKGYFLVIMSIILMSLSHTVDGQIYKTQAVAMSQNVMKASVLDIEVNMKKQKLKITGNKMEEYRILKRSYYTKDSKGNKVLRWYCMDTSGELKVIDFLQSEDNMWNMCIRENEQIAIFSDN